jgi:hypothetical protein
MAVDVKPVVAPPDRGVSSVEVSDAPPSSRSRRSVLAAGISGLLGLVFQAGARPEPTAAAAGDSIRMGQSNNAGTSNTSLTTSSSGTAWYVRQNGGGAAIRANAVGSNALAGSFTSTNGPAISAVTGHAGKYGAYAANDAASTGIGAAIRANGRANDGLIASTTAADRAAVVASNPGHEALSADGAVNATTSAIDASAVAGSARGQARSGVFGYFEGIGVGVFGRSYMKYGDGNVGVRGEASNFEGIGIGVSGQGWFGTGVHGQGSSGVVGSGQRYGLYGNAEIPDAFGLYSAGKAHVEGDLQVTGSISKAGGTFRIDHPLDPADRYLVHSFVESSEMLTVYSGTADLDANGRATVTLPRWFEALNRDVRYQLTAVGAPAPSLHVQRPLSDGRFVIGGGPAGLKVSWLLTATRKDPWALAHPIVVEQRKPANERGLYLHPDLYGKPAKQSIHAKRHQVDPVKAPRAPKRPPAPRPVR